MGEKSAKDIQMIYQATRIKTASKEQLLLMTYDIAIRFCLSAEQALSGGHTEEANESLKRGERAIRELMLSLDVESGGEVAENLMRLYDFMYYQLVDANIKRNAETVKTVRGMLEELRATWREAIDKLKKEAISTNVAGASGRSAGGLNFAG